MEFPRQWSKMIGVEELTYSRETWPGFDLFFVDRLLNNMNNL